MNFFSSENRDLRLNRTITFHWMSSVCFPENEIFLYGFSKRSLEFSFLSLASFYQSLSLALPAFVPSISLINEWVTYIPARWNASLLNERQLMFSVHEHAVVGNFKFGAMESILKIMCMLQVRERESESQKWVKLVKLTEWVGRGENCRCRRWKWKFNISALFFVCWEKQIKFPVIVGNLQLGLIDPIYQIKLYGIPWEVKMK